MAGGSALLEFIHLQALQRASIPSPRVVAHLSGFQINGILGDVVVIEAVENAVQLDRYLQEFWLSGKAVPQRKLVASQVVGIVNDIGKAKFGFDNLRLGCFLVADGKVHLHDVRGLRSGGLRINHVFTFAHHAARFATRTELLRGWDVLNPDSVFPRTNPQSPRLWKHLPGKSRHENDHFGTLTMGDWTGFFTRSDRFAQPWSAASRLAVSRSEWETAWPIVLAQLESDQLTLLKRDASGEVLGAEVILAGRPISVVLKRPRRKRLRQYVIDLFRPARAERMWLKAWMLIARNLPCEFPLLLMQRRKLGYTNDAIILFERVPGESLHKVKLADFSPNDREMLFRRAGRTLRRIEDTGLVHYDSKSTNWIVYPDPTCGPVPVMIDVDGIRPLNFWLQGWSILRLLRAMKTHPQYTPDDSLALCRGYAPFAPGEFEQEPDEAESDEQH